jgi:hypothetical protein
MSIVLTVLGGNSITQKQPAFKLVINYLMLHYFDIDKNLDLP